MPRSRVSGMETLLITPRDKEMLFLDLFGMRPRSAFSPLNPQS